MLLGDLAFRGSARVIIKSAPHEVSPLAVVLASPPVFETAVDCLGLHQVVVALGLHEVAVPFLETPEVVLEQRVQGSSLLFREVPLFLHFDQFDQGQDESGRVHFEDVLIHKLDLGHHGAYLKPSDLLPAYPSEQIDLAHPIVEHIDHLSRLVCDCNREVEAIVPEEASGEDETRGCEGVRVVQFVLEEGVLGVEDAVVEGCSSVQVEEDVTQELAVCGVLLCGEVGGVQVLALLGEGLLVEGGGGAVGDEDLITIGELSVEDKDHKLSFGPFVLLDQFQLVILPLDQPRIVLPLDSSILIELDEMLDLLHEPSGIITLRGIHRESKHAHTPFGLDCDMLTLSLEAIDIDLYPLAFLFGDCKLDGGGVLLVVDEFGIVVFNSHIGCPVDRVIPVSACQGIHLFHLDALLPGRLSQLVLDLRLHVEGLILDLLVDVFVSVVAHHVDVESVVGVLVPKPGFGEVLLVLGVGVVQPVCEAVVYGDGTALAEMEEEVGLVHAEGGERGRAAEEEQEEIQQGQFDHDMIMGFEQALHTQSNLLLGQRDI